MLLRLTDKLSKKLKTGPLTKVDKDPGPYLEWYGLLFSVDRSQYILTTEAKSLFSVVMYGRGVTDEDIYLQHLFHHLREYMHCTGNRLIYDRVIAPRTGLITMSKTSSKAVLGSMNMMARLCASRLEGEEWSPWDLSECINKTPFKAIRKQYPKIAFQGMELE